MIGLLKSFTRTTSFIGKEITEVVRRPGALISLVLGPFLIMGLFGIGYSGQYRPLVTLIVVPNDGSLPTDPQFYQQIAGPAVEIANVLSDPAAAEASLRAQQVDLVVIAPPSVENQFRSGEQAIITIEYNQLDPVRDNYARFVAETQVQNLNEQIIKQAASQGETYAVQQLGAQAAFTIPPDVVAAPTAIQLNNLSPTHPNVVTYFAPAVLALIIQHMGVTLASMSLVRERLSGAMDIFRVAPLRTLEILVGKYLAYGFLSLITGTSLTFLVVGVLGVPMLSPVVNIAGVVALLSFASLGLGLFISTIVDSERQAVQLSMLVLLASVFFSGFVLPLDQFVTPVRYAAHVLPVTDGIALLQDLMLRGSTTATVELTVLAIIAVVLFTATAFALRRNLREAD